MAQEKISLRFMILLGLVFITAMTRLLPHPPNFAPIGAMALFGAAYFRKPLFGLLITFLALWISDLVLNNVVFASYYDSFQLIGSPWVYLGFAAVFGLGLLALKKISAGQLAVTSVIGSILFFLITNLGAWQLGYTPYPKNIAGLLSAYAAGIPFFWYTLAGDLFYVAVLFGSFEFIKSRFPQLAFAK